MWAVDAKYCIGAIYLRRTVYMTRVYTPTWWVVGGGQASKFRANLNMQYVQSSKKFLSQANSKP